MLRLVSDEDFRRAIVRGLLLKQPELDVVRVQDVGLRQKSDEEILDWATSENRILLTHDRNTVPRMMKERLAGDRPVPGVMIVRQRLVIAKAIEDILLVAHCGNPDEWPDRMLYIPL